MADMAKIEDLYMLKQHASMPNVDENFENRIKVNYYELDKKAIYTFQSALKIHAN
jgi:hypothetical protein